MAGSDHDTPDRAIRRDLAHMASDARSAARVARAMETAERYRKAIARREALEKVPRWKFLAAGLGANALALVFVLWSIVSCIRK